MNSVLRVETHSDEETRALGRQLADRLPESGTVVLAGDLGSGKTTLAKGIIEGRGTGTADEIGSPTFTLIHEYGDPVSVYHVDLYRLESVEQVRRVGLEDLFLERALVLIEWGDRFLELMPENRIEIRLKHAGGDNRLIELLSPK